MAQKQNKSVKSNFLELCPFVSIVTLDDDDDLVLYIPFK